MGYTSIPSTEGVAVAIGVSALLCLIGIEYGIACAKNRSVHEFTDSVANLACGVIHQVANICYSSVILPAYEFLWHHCRIARIEHFSIINGVVLFLVIDLIYYWEHRLLHWNRFLWAAHVVHHQSEEFNFTVSLRVSVLQIWMTTASTMLLALLGFSPLMALTALLIYKVYQFWTHTRLIENLGFLEWVFVTPSHHRVHHAKNECYLDKNFGGMLIIWDRMFGTFEPEREPPRYGVVAPAAASFNPVLVNLHPWLVFAAARTIGPARPARSWATASHPARASVVLRLVAVMALTIALLLADSAGGSICWLMVMLVSVVWLWQLGRLLDGHHRVRHVDSASIVLALGTSFALAISGAAAQLIIASLLGGSVLIFVASQIGSSRVSRWSSLVHDGR